MKNQICPETLKCEYLVNPIGIDSPNPRLNWLLKAKRQGLSQKAYQVFVGTSSSEVASGNGKIWESGKITSDCIKTIYQGQRQNPFTPYYWSVKIRDGNGNWSNLSQVAFWETRMMGKENWQGNWISNTYDYNLNPALCFRKPFEIQKKVKVTMAYIAVAGLYELYQKGDKVGDHRLDPMFTRFDRRTLYVTYNVTQNQQMGENIIGILLGNGWYNHQSSSSWRFDKAQWRALPKFCLDLRITYEDGSNEVIIKDLDWKTALSPIIFYIIYTGEHYDARLKQSGWNSSGFDDSAWEPPICVGAPSQNIENQALHPICNVDEISAKKMVQLDDRTYIFDFGRNISGFSQIKVFGAKVTTLRMKNAERMDKKGRADQSNIDVLYFPIDNTDSFDTHIFIHGGRGEETFIPCFNYKGFQYVEVTANKPVKLTKESLTAYFMQSDVPAAGSIQSSTPVLNKIWQATNASYLSNLFCYLTDCSTCEKNGWTNDDHISIETGLYNFDVITILEKWLADRRYEQQSIGVLPVF